MAFIFSLSILCGIDYRISVRHEHMFIDLVFLLFSPEIFCFQVSSTTLFLILFTTCAVLY